MIIKKVLQERYINVLGRQQIKKRECTNNDAKNKRNKMCFFVGAVNSKDFIEVKLCVFFCSFSIWS